MSKLIKLPNGPYIPASAVIKVGEPWEEHIDSKQWNFTVTYKDPLDEENTHHKVKLNKLFIKDEQRAKEEVAFFVGRVNEAR